MRQARVCQRNLRGDKPVAQSSGGPPRWPIGERRSYELRSVRHVTFMPQPRDGATPPVAGRASISHRHLGDAGIGGGAGGCAFGAGRNRPDRAANRDRRAGWRGKRRLLELLAKPSYLQLSPTGQLRGLRLSRGHSAFSRGCCGRCSPACSTCGPSRRRWRRAAGQAASSMPPASTKRAISEPPTVDLAARSACVICRSAPRRACCR